MIADTLTSGAQPITPASSSATMDTVCSLHSVLISSGAIGYWKPDERAYQAALGLLDVATEECLFIDNEQANVEAARRVGMQALLLDREFGRGDMIDLSDVARRVRRFTTTTAENDRGVERDVMEGDTMTPLTVQDAVVLVIDDNPDNVLIAERILKRDVGIQHIHSYASGGKLFPWLDDHPNESVHLMLLDLQLPNEDGYDVARRVRQYPQFSHIKIIALTANVLPRTIERCRDEDFQGFIGKPIRRERFASQIRRILAGEAVWEAQ